MTLYCVDTSALLEASARVYPMDVFGSLWAHFDKMIECGDLLSPDEVLHELEKREDGVYRWAKARKQLFYPIDTQLQQAVTEVMLRFPRLMDSRPGHNLADPWVVALAKITGRTVVTCEKQTGNDRNPRIPDVCIGLGVPWITLLQLIRDEKLSF
jgi:Domain of unknown function (DUF4411)